MVEQSKRKRWLIFALFTTLLTSILVLISIITGFTTSTYSTTVRDGSSPVSQLQPSFGYYINGGSGDKEQIMRLLLAVYHPRNRYLLHLAADASDKERKWLADAVKAVPAVREFGNVEVIGRPSWLTGMGATHIAATLRAAAILLRLDGGWDWFICLSAYDYPLVTQDDLAYVFSSVKKDLNFIEHTSDLSWKEEARIQPIVIDPSIYLDRKSQLFTAAEKRPTPDAFKIFTGSPWAVLSRSFMEFCIIGWDNLPRTMLMYFNNAMFAQEWYFHSVICNSPEFSNTTINNNLRYMVWDSPPKMDVHYLGVSDYDQMIQSGAAFARRFKKDDPVLTMIDEKILKRKSGQVGPGAWCGGDVNSVKPGFQATRLSENMTRYLDDLSSETAQCK
ncbi:beta-glucuronosyltransferase GlcAT14A-like [Silene latifolia]|uniref:beta-glucuronosyltransferase GlcAT14A-like n=1 Tax=Silene latifolia TaxID=37657 RepID=UPI003D785866